MTSINTIVVAVVVLVSIATRQGDGCYCQLRHPQEHYCKADYVVLAGILDKDVIYNGDMPMETHYTVNIKKVYKSSLEYENATKTVIISPASSVACAVEELQTGINYLITGIITDDSLHTSFCDWVKPYGSLTRTQMNGFRSKYNFGCQCEFAFCREENCGQEYTNATCEWEMGDMFDCYHNEGICYRNRERCVWRETRRFTSCEEELYFGDLPDSIRQALPPAY